MAIPTSIPAKNPRIIIGEIYIKDVSFETFHSPLIFKTALESWDPTITPEYHAKINPVVKDWYEVVFTVSVKTVLGEEVAYIAEVHYAGVFSFKQIDAEESERLLRCDCLGILFPFARETIYTLVQKGGFNPLKLPLIEFDNEDVVQWEGG